PKNLHFKNVGPGRYVAEMPLENAGSYMIGVFPGKGYAPLRAGVNVPYSREFLDSTTNEALLLQLASLTPRGGQPGEIIRLPDNTADWKRWKGSNVFRPDLPRGQSQTSVWPLLMLVAAGVFFADVFHRRVALNWSIAGAVQLLRRAQVTK